MATMISANPSKISQIAIGAACYAWADLVRGDFSNSFFVPAILRITISGDVDKQPLIKKRKDVENLEFLPEHVSIESRPSPRSTHLEYPQPADTLNLNLDLRLSTFNTYTRSVNTLALLLQHSPEEVKNHNSHELTDISARSTPISLLLIPKKSRYIIFLKE
ncbi:hypothetical protein L1987_07227 [Smallanthus sonchifolius]|uniref:Uncharacterized protein n=1 Tax=Smallanthus sonchifolius TaxID=185202 RepID=A0ACB9K054_9ASTR|nr:hypothetical protein L1987_07227 [Smallanthus sonchifolius]